MSDDQAKRPMRRGLSALMADVGVGSEDANKATPRDRLMPVEALRPNPEQPRRTFREEDLADLAASVREKGILQPIIVRPASDGDYQIVAGERRWRAAQMAGLHEVPVIERDLNDTEALEVGIIENIQRADLNAIEEALGFQALMQRFGHTQEQLGEVLGKSRSHIANLLRLLKLPEAVQDHLRNGTLSAGHARALVNSDEAEALAARVVAKGLSVRETERLAKGRAERPAKPAPTKADGEVDAATRALQADISAAIGMVVAIKHSGNGRSGTMTIAYDSLDGLDKLCSILTSGTAGDEFG